MEYCSDAIPNFELVNARKVGHNELNAAESQPGIYLSLQKYHHNQKTSLIEYDSVALHTLII